MGDQEQILTYENLIEQFLKDFPEFNEKAKETREEWVSDMWDEEEILTGVFFASVLVPYLMREGLVKLDNQQLLDRLFAFMEKMALSIDPVVPELLEAEILEMIGDDKSLLNLAREFMGEKTLEHSHHIERSLGRE
jgi:hypothetical protein